MSTTLTRKGQVTIPKRIRDALGLQPGGCLELEVDERGRIVMRKVIEGDAGHAEAGGDRFERARGAGDGEVANG